LKKLLYSALIAAMVLGLSASTFGAAGDIAKSPFSDIAGHKAEADLTLLAAFGIFTGESGLGGAVKPEDPITRAQFCKVLVLAAGKGSTAAGLAGLKPTFTDEVPAWAWGFVNTAFYMQVITGYGDGTFQAGRNVTYGEAVTMLVKAISGQNLQVPAGGIWPYNYIFYAVDTGFNNSPLSGLVDVGFASLPCTRGDMARLLTAAMAVHPINKNGVITGAALLETTEDASVADGGHVGTDLNNVFVGVDSWVGDMGDPVYLVGAKTYADLMGTDTWTAEKAAKAVFIQKLVAKSITGVYVEKHVDGTKEYIELADGTKVLLPAVPGNCVTLNLVASHDITGLAAGDELLVNVDGNGKVAYIFAFRWDLFGLAYGEDYVTDVTKSTTTPPVDTHVDVAGGNFNVPKEARVTINGAAAGRDDLATKDVVMGATEGTDGLVVIAVSAARNLLQGIVTGSSTVFNPDEHRFVTVKVGDVSKTYERVGYAYDQTTPTVGDLVKYALDAGGNLFFYVLFTAANPVVLVTGATTEIGSTTKYFLIADVAGVSKTFECVNSDEATHIGFYGTLTVAGDTGKVTGVTDIVVAHDVAAVQLEVVAIGADNVTLKAVLGGAISFVTKPAVYLHKESTGATTYLGLGGLAVGDIVYADGASKVLQHNH
jgi:hypothetical protein